MSKAALDRPVPDFTLPATNGGEISLSDFKGTRVVLYFYPKDSTPGCTTEGQNCAGCNLYQGGTAAAGPCAIFGGKDVQATGWCKSWVKKM